MSALDVFQYGQHQVRTATIGGEPWFVLADLTTVLGIRQFRTDRLDDDVIRNHPIRDRLGRDQNAVIVSEPGMYEVVLRSDKPEAKRFRWWLTHEVLPAVRKTGSYSTTPALPQNYSAALRELAAEVEQREALEAKVAADAPKVLFADAVAAADTDVLVGDLAKILRGNGVAVGANRLFHMLREDGYLIRRRGSDWNMPTQRSMELGLFRVKETAVTHSAGHVTISKTPKVTGKGQTYFVNRYAARALEVAS